MAIAVDQANIGSNATLGSVGTSYSFNTSAIVAAGATIIVAGGYFGSAGVITSLSGGGLSWTVDKQGKVANTSIWMASAYAPSGLVSGTTITVNADEELNYPTMGGMSLQGVQTSTPVDGTPLGPTQVATAAWSSGNYSIAAGSVIVAVNYSEGVVTGNTPTAPSLESYDTVTAGDQGGTMEYRIEAAAGSYAVAGAWNTGNTNTNIAVAYLAATGGDLVTAPQIQVLHRHALGGGRW